MSASGAACVPAPRRVGTSWANGKNSHIQQLHLLQVALCPWHINDNAPRWSNVANSSECTKRARVQGEICIGRVQRRHQTRLLIAASLAACKVIFKRRVSSLLLPRAWSKVLNWGERIDVSLWIESIALQVLQLRHFSSSLWGTPLVIRSHRKYSPDDGCQLGHTWEWWRPASCQWLCSAMADLCSRTVVCAQRPGCSNVVSRFTTVCAGCDRAWCAPMTHL